MLTLLEGLGARGRSWARAVDPWTNVYGLARTLIAGSTAMTLAFNRTTTLFVPAAGGIRAPLCDGVRGGGLYCLVPEHDLGLARWIAVALLLVVASGYRPRFTGVLHWWLAFSLQANALTIDGGDNAAAVLSLLLIPVTLTDPRKWHWQKAPAVANTASDDALRLVALVTLVVVRVQVAGIYFHAAIGKLAVEEWTNGTALYYLSQSPIFGASGVVAAALRAIVVSAVGVTLMTWSVLVLEYFLSAGLVMPKRFWGTLYVLGLSLHAGIIVIHGLWSFSTVMFAALTLYLRPTERPFALDRWLAVPRRLARAVRIHLPSSSPERAGQAS
jgi:antimicrobial peptide system SdpB family protein